MNKNGSLALAAALCFGAAACSHDVRQEAITPSNHDAVTQDVAKSSLPDDVKKDYIAGLFRSTIDSSYSIDGKTVQNVVDDTVKVQADADARAAEQKAAQDREAAKEAEIKREAHDALNVQVLSKHFIPASMDDGTYDDRLKIDEQIHVLGQGIQAFKGTIEFDSLLGDKMCTYDFDVEQKLPANVVVTADSTSTVNQYLPNEDRCAHDPIDHFKISWHPATILFEDGKKIEVADDQQ